MYIYVGVWILSLSPTCKNTAGRYVIYVAVGVLPLAAARMRFDTVDGLRLSDGDTVVWMFGFLSVRHKHTNFKRSIEAPVICSEVTDLCHRANS